MNSESFHRTQAGVPEGGQFAAVAHPESPVRLFDRNDGSFFRPSPSSTAEHCIGFWQSVAIPDEVITQIEDVYSQQRLKEVAETLNARVGDWQNQWTDENPPPRFNKDSWEARFEEARRAFMARARVELEQERPMTLGSYDSRQLVRAAQMYYHLPDHERFPDENIKVRDHPVELFNETLTVEEIQTKYRLYGLHFALERIFEDRTEKDLLNEVRNLNERVGVVQNEIIEGRRDRQF